MRYGLTATFVAGLALSACTGTKQVADIGFRPPEGSYKLIVMRPDISVGLLTTGGLVEVRQDWTDSARENIVKALIAQQAMRGGEVKIAATREEAGGDVTAVADLERLHRAVGDTIRAAKYAGPKLPTKEGRFDWTLGNAAVEYGRASGYDYALFVHAEDSFSSGGRVALQAVAFMGCMVGVCLMPHGGERVAFASLVDLHTGQIVWFNVLASSVGDMRTPEGASNTVSSLLDKMKPGSDIRAKAKHAA